MLKNGSSRVCFKCQAFLFEDIEWDELTRSHFHLADKLQNNKGIFFLSVIKGTSRVFMLMRVKIAQCDTSVLLERQCLVRNEVVWAVVPSYIDSTQVSSSARASGHKTVKAASTTLLPSVYAKSRRTAGAWNGFPVWKPCPVWKTSKRWCFPPASQPGHGNHL